MPSCKMSNLAASEYVLKLISKDNVKTEGLHHQRDALHDSDTVHVSRSPHQDMPDIRNGPHPRESALQHPQPQQR